VNRWTQRNAVTVVDLDTPLEEQFFDIAAREV
jgi:hypothetical protein